MRVLGLPFAKERASVGFNRAVGDAREAWTLDVEILTCETSLGRFCGQVPLICLHAASTLVAAVSRRTSGVSGATSGVSGGLLGGTLHQDVLTVPSALNLLIVPLLNLLSHITVCCPTLRAPRRCWPGRAPLLMFVVHSLPCSCVLIRGDRHGISREREKHRVHLSFS